MELVAAEAESRRTAPGRERDADGGSGVAKHLRGQIDASATWTGACPPVRRHPRRWSLTGVRRGPGWMRSSIVARCRRSPTVPPPSDPGPQSTPAGDDQGFVPPRRGPEPRWCAAPGAGGGLPPRREARTACRAGSHIGREVGSCAASANRITGLSPYHPTTGYCRFSHSPNISSTLHCASSQ